MACISANAVTTGMVNESAKRYALLVKVIVNNIVVVVSLADHPTRLPLSGTELGIRKSHPPLTSRETKATPTNQLY